MLKTVTFTLQVETEEYVDGNDETFDVDDEKFLIECLADNFTDEVVQASIGTNTYKIKRRSRYAISPVRS